MEEAVTLMPSASISSATYLLVMNLVLLICLDALYCIHSLATALRKLLFFSLPARSTTVHLSVLGLALAITLHKIVANLVVNHEVLVGYARYLGSILDLDPSTISGLLLSTLLVTSVMILAAMPVLKWYPALRRMLRAGSDAPVEKHVPFASWAVEERWIICAVESRRRRQRQQHLEEKGQSGLEKGVAPATYEDDICKAAEPDQVLRENAETRSIYALVCLNGLWLLMACIEWYMASEEFGRGETIWQFIINAEVVSASFFSWYTWLDCLITWGEALVEVRRSQN